MADKWSQYEVTDQAPDAKSKGDKWSQYEVKDETSTSTPAKTSANAPPAKVGSTNVEQIQSLLKGKKFTDLSFREKLQVLSLGFKEYSQRKQNAAAGTEANAFPGPVQAKQPSTIERIKNRLQSVLAEYGGVALGTMSGMMDPKNAAAAAISIPAPELGAAYFGISGIADLPDEAKEAIKNPTPENVQAALLSGAQVAGAGAGLEGEGEKAARGASKLKEGLQRRIGIGPTLTKEAVEKTSTSYAKEVEAVKEKNATEAAKTAERNKAATDKFEKQKGDIEKQNQEAAEAHKQAVQRVEEVNAARREAVGKRTELANQIETDSTSLGQGLKELENTVREEGNKKYAEVREKVGNDSVDPSDLQEAVQYAQDKLIQGSPESIKQFNTIMNRGAEEAPAIQGVRPETNPELYEDLREKVGLPKIESKPMTFSDLQGLYTELGNKLAAGGMIADVYRALKYVQDKVGDQMQVIADRNDAGAEFKGARKFWRQFMETFHDDRALAASGSPLAKALKASDPGFIRDPFLGKAGQRGVDMLNKVADFSTDGAQHAKDLATRADQIRKNYQSMSDLPKKVREEEAPERPKEKPIPEPPKSKVSQVQPPPDKPVVEPRKLKEEKIQQISKRMLDLNKRDVYILTSSVVFPLLGLAARALGLEGAGLGAIGLGGISLVSEAGIKQSGLMLENPKFVHWLSEPSPGDLTALYKLPPEIRENMGEQIQAMEDQAKKRGTPPHVDERVRQVLKMTAPAAAASGNQRKTRKDLIDRGAALARGDEE